MRKKQIENLKMTVSMQSISVAEITKIQEKSNYLDKEIKCLEKECEDYSHYISKYESEAAQKRDKILQSAHNFNRTIIQLEQLIPELKDFHIHMDLENDHMEEEMEKIVKSLETLKNKYISKKEELESQLKDYQKGLDTKKQTLKELVESIQALKKKNEAKRKENEELARNFEEVRELFIRFF